LFDKELRRGTVSRTTRKSPRIYSPGSTWRRVVRFTSWPFYLWGKEPSTHWL